MNRLFGTTPKGPKMTPDIAISRINARIAESDVKIAALNAEFNTYAEKLKRMRDGPGKNALKQKATKVLQKRKAEQVKKDQLDTQVGNLENTEMMKSNLENVMIQVDVMKTTQKELKKQYGKVDIDKIERLQDEMADLMDVSNDIQESLSRSYDVPEDVDEAELDAELEALGAEVDMEMELAGGQSMPSFMQDEVPEFIDDPPLTGGKVKEAAGGAA